MSLSIDQHFTSIDTHRAVRKESATESLIAERAGDVFLTEQDLDMTEVDSNLVDLASYDMTGKPGYQDIKLVALTHN